MNFLGVFIAESVASFAFLPRIIHPQFCKQLFLISKFLKNRLFKVKNFRTKKNLTNLIAN